MKASIVMATHNRPVQLCLTLLSITKQKFRDFEVIVIDDGDDFFTPRICEAFDAKYFKMNRPQGGYKNPARPINAGVRKATGEIIILQNPECLHVSDELISRLCNQVREDNAVFCQALSLNEDGSHDQWYCHGECNARPFFFCGAIRKSWFEKLRGFDEDFKNYGYEDDDLSYRLTAAGVKFEYSDLLVHHQWHPSGAGEISSTIFDEKRQQFLAGEIGIERNVGREWGCLD